MNAPSNIRGFTIKQNRFYLATDFLTAGSLESYLSLDSKEEIVKIRMKLFKSDELVVKHLCVRTSSGILQPTRELFPKKRVLVSSSNKGSGNFKEVINKSWRVDWKQFSDDKRNQIKKLIGTLRIVKRDMRWHPRLTMKKLYAEKDPEHHSFELDKNSNVNKSLLKKFKREARIERDVLKKRTRSIKHSLRVMKRNFNKKYLFGRRFTIYYQSKNQ